MPIETAAFANTRFSSDVLSSSEKLSRFLSGDKEIREITTATGKPSFRNWLGRWNVVWLIIVVPFTATLGSVAYLTAAVLGFVGPECLYRRIHVFACHILTRPVEALECYWKYGTNYLITSVNMHRLDSSDFYLQPNLRIDTIKDKQILDATFQSIGDTELNFFHPRGACRGMTDWFIFLYLKTKDKFKNPTAHIQAVSKQMESGASPQAALLHTLDSERLEFMNLTRSSSFISPEELNTDKALETIQNLPSGIYNVGLALHGIAYIKINNQLGFIFDSNPGTILMDGVDSTQKVLNYFRGKQKEYAIDIQIESVSLKQHDHSLAEDHRAVS